MAEFIEFEQTVVKLDSDGNKVLSNRLYAGEKIAHTGQTFAQAKAERTVRITLESTSGYTKLKDDAKEPEDGSITATLDPSKTSTVRGSYSSTTN